MIHGRQCDFPLQRGGVRVGGREDDQQAGAAEQGAGAGQQQREHQVTVRGQQCQLPKLQIMLVQVPGDGHDQEGHAGAQEELKQRGQQEQLGQPAQILRQLGAAARAH